MRTLMQITYSVVIAVVVLVALVMISTVLPMPGRLAAKVVLSGSMEPTIPTGSLVFIRPSATYTEGDVITFGSDTRGAVPTTHRITAVRATEGRYVFTTRGDANNAADMADVSEDRVIGKVFFSLPLLGYLVSFAKTPLGFLLVVIMPALLVIVDELRTIVRTLRGGRAPIAATAQSPDV